MSRVTIVTLCGSMRFFPQILQTAAKLTEKGFIVLAPFSVVAPAEQGDEFKAMLDRLHFQKIDMADQVIVVTNQNGYIGTSTRNEMAYALQAGKLFDIVEFDIPGTDDLGIGYGHRAFAPEVTS